MTLETLLKPLKTNAELTLVLENGEEFTSVFYFEQGLQVYFNHFVKSYEIYLKSNVVAQTAVGIKIYCVPPDR